MVAEAGIHPTDLAGQRERQEEQQRHQLALMVQHRADLAQLVMTPHGRRVLRRQLREAGFRFDTDLVPTLNPDSHARMAFDEAMRARGMQLLWPIVRMAAHGEIPLDQFQTLFSEKDER